MRELIRAFRLEELLRHTNAKRSSFFGGRKYIETQWSSVSQQGAAPSISHFWCTTWLTRPCRRWWQDVDLSRDSMPLGVTTARERLETSERFCNCSSKEVLRFYYVQKNELRSSP
jgi:hypothetical protein